jgi:MFS family permease
MFSTAPLRSPLFRRYLLCASLINICLWTYLTGLQWTLLARTGSAANVALIQTLMTVPLPLVMLPAGLLTDRFGSRALMVVAYAGYATCVAVSGVLVLGDSLPVVGVLGLAFLLGCFDALNVVAAPVFVGRSVPPADMGAAIGLSTLAAGFGRIAGGPLGGAIVAAFGPSAALLPAAGILVLAMLIVSTLPTVTDAGATAAARWRRADLMAGVEWARRTPIARLLVLLGATSALVVSGYVPLVTIVDRQLLNGGPAELGVLTASGGIGMIVAAFLVDSVGRNAGRVRTAILALVVAALLLSALSMSRTFALSALLVALTAGTIATYSATASMLIQTAAPAALRGRAVALYGLVFYTLQPIGIVTLGVFADRVGVAAVLEGMTVATALAVGTVVVTNRGIWPALLGRDSGLETPTDAVRFTEVATDSAIGT